MIRFIALFLGLATLGYFSPATWANPATSTAPLKEAQCKQSVCTKNCDAKGQKCLVTCDDKATGNNCRKNLNHVTPYGVLEITPKRASP
jgi:hypothetical protein